MSDVRNIISSLCVVLNKVLDEEIRAEHFRLAKFNKSEKSNVNHIWNILHKLCCPSFQQNFSEAGKCKGNNKDVVLCVKLCFHSHHYDCFSFYCLTSDMITGSRELLLAFGWLLGETNALEMKLWTYIKNNMFKRQSSQQCLEDRLLTYTHATPDTIKSTGDIFNHIIWLAGKIKHNFKSIFNSTSEKMSMNSKIESQTKGALNLPFLSVEQIMLLKDSNSTYAVPENVLKDTKTVLENYFYFVKKEHLFWSWMESVIHEDRNNTIKPNKNNVDYCKFMDAVKIEIKNEILEETSDEYNKIDTEIINHNNYNGNDNDVNQDTLLEINKDVERLNNIYKNKINDVNGLLERLKTDSPRSADSE